MRPWYAAALVVSLCLFWASARVKAQPIPQIVDSEQLASLIEQHNRDILGALPRGSLSRRSIIAVDDVLLLRLAQRAFLMDDLISRNPQRALELALPDEVAAGLRAARTEARPLVEGFGEWDGPVAVFVEDDFQAGTSETIVELDVEGEPHQVYFPETPPRLLCGQQLHMRGMRFRSKLVAAAATPGERSQSACSASGVKRIAVLLVEFPSASLPSFATPAHFENVLFSTTQPSLNGYWQESSYGATSATGSAFGPYTLNSVSCSLSSLSAAAINAADADVNFNNFDQVYVIIPDHPNACSFLGVGSVGCWGRTSSNDQDGHNDGFFSVGVSAMSIGNDMSTAAYMVSFAGHEGGHNLTLDHSSSLEFGNEELGPLAASGTHCEYGGVFSTMGVLYMFRQTSGGPIFALTGHYAAFHKSELGWLTAGSGYQQVETSGTFNIQRATATNGLRALRIRRGTGNNLWVWLEYRTQTGDYEPSLGFHSGTAFSGALLHYETPDDSSFRFKSRLLDFQPGSASGSGCAGTTGSADFGEVTLLPGSAWNDPYSNLSITVNSVTNTQLNVTVSYGGAPPPTQSQQGFVSVQDGELVWFLDANGNGIFDPGVDPAYTFGVSGVDKPIVGDWNGDGMDEIGYVRVSGGSLEWGLDLNGDGMFDGADTIRNYGLGGVDSPVAGDWDGDGTDEIGYVRVNGNSLQWGLDFDGDGVPDALHTFGAAGQDVPIVGDWDGDGTDEIATVRQSGPSLDWRLDNGDGVANASDQVVSLGTAHLDLPVAGDWNGDGTDELGTVRPNGNQIEWRLDSNGNEIFDGGEVPFTLGAMSDMPVVGGW